MRINREFGVLAMMEATGRPRGLHSDDGQQTVALCDAILADPKNPAPGFAKILVELYTDGPRERGRFGHHRGTGSNFRKTVEKLNEGAGLYEASTPSAGNGNAMLIAPAAWFWSNDLKTLLAKVLDISLVKQHSICGVASAAAVAHIVAHAIEEGGLESYQFHELVEFVCACERQAAERLIDRGLVEQPDNTFSSALTRALEVFDLPRQEVILAIETIANETADRKVYASSGYSVASVITSLYFALASSSLFDAIVDTVNLGGDADTTGAMVGSIVGAAAGFEAIPQEWLKDLVACGAFDDRVEPMALRIAGWKPAKSLVELEAQWTARWPSRERPPLGPLWQHARPRRDTPLNNPRAPLWEEDDDDDDPWPEFADAHEADQHWVADIDNDDDDDDDDDPWEEDVDPIDANAELNDDIQVDEDALNEALTALGGRPVGQAGQQQNPGQPSTSGPFPRPLALDPTNDNRPYRAPRGKRRGWQPRAPRLERHNPAEQPCPPRELGDTLTALANAEYEDVFGRPWSQPTSSDNQPTPEPQTDGERQTDEAASQQPSASQTGGSTQEPKQAAQVSLFPDLEP